MHTHACTRTHAHTYFTVFFLPYICLLKGKHSCAFHAILIYFSYMVKTRYFIPFPSCPHLQQVISAIPNQSSDKNHVSSRIRSFFCFWVIRLKSSEHLWPLPLHLYSSKLISSWEPETGMWFKYGPGEGKEKCLGEENYICYFPCCHNKIFDKSHLREEEVLVWAWVSGPSPQAMPSLSCCGHSQEAGRDECWCSACLLTSIVWNRSPGDGDGATHIEVCVSTSVNAP